MLRLNPPVLTDRGSNLLQTNNKQQTMKTPALIALAAGIPLALTAAVSVGLYRASVHEQICLSYERQGKAGMTELLNLAKEADGVLSQIQANPFSALGYMTYPAQMTEKLNEIKTKLNDTKYALVGTCGTQRFDNFIKRPDMRQILSDTDAYSDSIRLRAAIGSN